MKATIVSIEESAGEKRQKKARIYFSHQGESVITNLVERRSRPTFVYKNFFPQVLEYMKLKPEDYKFVWSQKAGCTCGCSPGFILQPKTTNVCLNKDIFVTIDFNERTP